MRNRLIYWSIIIIVPLFLIAADYDADKSIDELDDVSGSVTTSAKILIQDMSDTDRIGIATLANIADEIAESIAEGELADAIIVDADIKDDVIQEPALNTSNAPTDNYILSYNAAGTNFTWVEDQTSAGGWSSSSTYALGDLSDSACTTATTVCDITSGEVVDTLVTTYGWDGGQNLNIALPAAADGYKITFVVAVTDSAEDFYIDCDGSDKFYLDGTALDDGDRVYTQEPTIGEAITCVAATLNGTNYEWFCYTINGLWEDGS